MKRRRPPATAGALEGGGDDDAVAGGWGGAPGRGERGKRFRGDPPAGAGAAVVGVHPHGPRGGGINAEAATGVTPTPVALEAMATATLAAAVASGPPPPPPPTPWPTTITVPGDAATGGAVPPPPPIRRIPHRKRKDSDWGGECVDGDGRDWRALGGYDRFPGYLPGAGGGGAYTDAQVLRGDPRLELLHPSWLGNGARVLDVGCGAGYTAVALALNPAFDMRCVLGVDCNPLLIRKARKVWAELQVMHAATVATAKGAGGGGDPTATPASDAATAASATFHVPLSLRWYRSAPATLPVHAAGVGARAGACDEGGEAGLGGHPLPEVHFLCEDFVGVDHDTITHEPDSFHLITCWDVTKWVHLNHGDAGVCMLFRKLHRLLKPGGRACIVAQPWESYLRAAHRLPALKPGLARLHMRPTDFLPYMMSKVGFTTLVKSTTFRRQSSGAVRHMWVLQK